MKKIFSFTILFAAAVVALVSCTKHQGDIEENIPVATINFVSPTTSSIYHNGDSIAIQATAISTAAVHGYDVIIKKVNDTTKLFFQHVHDHNDTLLINQKWKNTVTAPANMEAQVILYLDHEGHTATKKAGFKVQ
jgi:hypothetical protein